MAKKCRSTKRTRRLACKLAAQVMAGRKHEALVPTLWGLAVFFENHIDEGHRSTKRDFGPKKPVKLKVAK